MKTFKVISVSEKTEKQLSEGVNTTRFISYESAIRLFTNYYNIKDEIKGYKVTEKGIEILY